MSLHITDSVSAAADVISRIRCALSKDSQYFPYGGSGYRASVTQYYESSTEVARAAIQPGSVEDLQLIVREIAKSHVPFAVKCGGHSSNPRFSSTTGGLQIYLVRFNEIRVDVKNKLVHVGAGCLFEEVYQELHQYGLNIVGGSGLGGVGLSGWMLGGGFSVKTNQYGLGIDNLAAVKIVLPNGEYTEASETENPDLFMAIKGGGNNFGIVTEFTLKAHDQGEYEDFRLTFKDHFDDVNIAILNIIAKQDNRANIEAAFRHNSEPGTSHVEVVLTVDCVYDGEYSEDPFKELEEIPHISSTRHKEAKPSFLHADLYRSYHNGTCGFLDGFSNSKEPFGLNAFAFTIKERPRPPMLGISQFPRGRWGNVMVDEFTPGIIDEIRKQSSQAAEKIKEYGGTRVAIGLWPFNRAMFDHATHSAWPHDKGKPNCPIMVYFTWEGEKNDKYWVYTMKKTLKALKAKVHQERPSSIGLPNMINTSLAEATTLEDLYGENLGWLGTLRELYDPNGVMNKTGGYRIPYRREMGHLDEVKEQA